LEILEDTMMQYKRDLLRKVIIVMSIVILVMIIVRMYEANYFQAISDFILSIFLIYSYKRLKDIGKSAFYTLARVGFVLAYITLFILLIHTHENLIHYIWFSTSIYLMFYILDKREAWLWFLSIISILTVIFFYDSTLMRISIEDLFIWIFNMFAILLIINWYEKTKKESEQRLIEIQYLLNNQVKEKTFELQVLNERLKERVKTEVEKNREKEKQFLQQARLAQMGEMISMISHQWRQPLAAISATSASIELKANMGKLDNKTALQKARNISDFSQHLSRTIDDFRNFFRPHKEKRETTYDAVIGSVLGIIEISISNKNIQLYKELDCHNTFMSYPNELQQVVLNLIQNAKDILLEKKIENPYIKIKTYQAKDKYILEVSDNGGGIPEEIIGKIFDPYFSTKTKKEGKFKNNANS